MKQQHQDSEVTIGLDLGERRHRFCVLNGQGEVIEEGSLLNDRASLEEFSGRYGGALTVMEAGCHSPWISRCLERLGCRVVVANPRKVRAIYEHERKSDRRDALMLARLGRLDPALLYPVRHVSQEAQEDLLRTSKRGDAYLRRLLVSAAQYILGPFGPAQCAAPVWIGIGSRRHSTREEARGGGCRSRISRAAFNSVEEQKRLSSLPRPQRRKIEDFRSGTIAMHRLKCLDFDNQMATFHPLNL